jgi:DNA polymerase-3 subunit gamma/tau
MTGLALYRKYRPIEFKEVLGQDHIVDVLASSIEEKKISHAYLFVGSRGIGKTSVARIFADRVGVSKNDLYEIDAASNRGIEDIKELRNGVNVLPFDSKYKIYIIDEVHMLSKDAWGALLKTLEEPPKHVIFILATTELQKVPETIVSRCQVFTFRRATEEILKKMLSTVAGKEGYEMDNGSAELLAILGDGSYRDALGTLQKVLNFSKSKKIKLEEVEKITGSPKTSLVNDFISALVERKLALGLETVRRAAKENLDMKLYAKMLIQKFRAAVFLKYVPGLEKELASDLSEEDLNFLKKLIKRDSPKGQTSNRVSQPDVFNSHTLAVLLEAYQKIDQAFVAELPLELALIKILENTEV